MARILVTGSEGFIGKHLVKALRSEGKHEIVGYDLGHTFVKGPFDGIIHLAAMSRVRDGEKDPVGCLEANVILTGGLLLMNPEWFIFSSSMEKPVNVYGLSKKTAEELVRLMAPKHIILRFSNVYGKGMAEDKLLSRIGRGEVKAVDEVNFPFEHIAVDDVVVQILRMVEKFNEPAFKSFTMKMSTGVAKTYEDLVDVATSY